MKIEKMKMSLAIVAIAGLMFAGCAKKEEAVAPEAAPQETTVETVEPVETAVEEPASKSVYFAFDSSELDAAARAILDANAEWIIANNLSITVEGNCDERGTREYNLALGQRRADSVRNYLEARGVSSSWIDTVSFGEERPACDGSGEACWAQNRRADIVTR